MVKSRSNESCLHISYGFLGWDCWNIKTRPLLAQLISQHIEVRVALADLKFAFHVIANNLICDVVIVLHGLLHTELFPAWVLRYLEELTHISVHDIG